MRRITNRFYYLRSRTVRVLGAYLPAIGGTLELLRAQVEPLREYIPQNIWIGFVIAGVVGTVLRVVTTKPLSAYKDGDQ